jgi:hypothetical protein
MRHAVARAPQLVIDMQYSSAGITEDRIHALMQKCFDQNLRSARLWYVVRRRELDYRC